MTSWRRCGAVSWRAPLVLFALCEVLALLLAGCGSAPSSAASASPVPTCATSSAPQAGPTLYALIGYPAAPSSGTANTTLEALDAQHGCLLWKVSQVGQTQYDVGQGIVYLVSRPDFVYSTTPKQSTIFAYDAHTGALRWKVQEPTTGGIIATPEGVLFVETVGKTGALPLLNYVALGAADGKPQWSYQTTLSLVVFGTTAYLYGGGHFPNLRYPNAVTALDLATGRERWQVGQPTTPLWLVADRQAVYLGEEGGGSGQIDTLVALGAQDGQPLWTFQTPVVLSPPVSTGSTLYLATSTTPATTSTPKGTLSALTAADGKTSWSIPTDALSGLIVGGDTLFGNLGYAQHGVVALTLNDGNVRWKVTTHLATRNETVASGFVLLGLGQPLGIGPGTDSIEALSASDGSLRWTIQTGGFIQEGLSLPETHLIGKGDSC